jgi:parvulin-like peptidyl-prolyl isomerase
MTRSSFEKELRTAALADSYTTSKAQPSGYTEAELQETYDAAPDRYSIVDYEAVIFPSSNYATDAVEATETTPAVEASDGTAEALTAAQEALAAYKDGASLEALAEEAGLTYTNTKSLYGTSDMLAWLFDEARAEGDADVVDYTYYGVPMGSVVVVFHGKERADFHSVDVRHILVADEAEANDLLAQYLAGEQTEDAFAELANKYSEDPGSNSNGGLYENVYKNQMVEEFNDFCFADGRKAGDVDVVYNENTGYHLIYFVGEGMPYTDYVAQNLLRSEDFSAWQEEFMADWEDAVTELRGMKYVD